MLHPSFHWPFGMKTCVGNFWVQQTVALVCAKFRVGSWTSGTKGFTRLNKNTCQCRHRPNRHPWGTRHVSQETSWFAKLLLPEGGGGGFWWWHPHPTPDGTWPGATVSTPSPWWDRVSVWIIFPKVWETSYLACKTRFHTLSFCIEELRSTHSLQNSCCNFNHTEDNVFWHQSVICLSAVGKTKRTLFWNE